MVVSLVRAPRVQRGGCVTEEVGAVRLAVPPLVNRRVHQASLGVALPFALDELLFERTQEELVGLLALAQLDWVGCRQFLEQGRLRVIVVAPVADRKSTRLNSSHVSESR